MKIEDLKHTHNRIREYIHKTPIHSSRLINELACTDILFKCENFQRMGAFKMRGAINAILKLSDEQKKKGVLTHSSGNFAQAISLAAAQLGIKAYIVMPKNAPQVKKNAVIGYGGHIIESASAPSAREEMSVKVQADTGATFIHPSDDLNVISGQGTSAYEFLQEIPDLDVVIAPVGGGGLIAGTSLAVKHYGKNCTCVGAEPFEVDDAFRSLQSGKIEYNETSYTIADGLRTNLGETNFPIIQKNVSEIIRVEEDEIIHAMSLVWERMKIIIEPSSAVALAAVLREKDKFKDKKTGVIISGGNVDLSNLPF